MNSKIFNNKKFKKQINRQLILKMYVKKIKIVKLIKKLI